MHYLVKSFFVWILFIPLATANAAFRDLVLIPLLGDASGSNVSSLILALLILGVTFLLLSRLGLRTRAECMATGALWFSLTLIFEMSFFIFARIHPLDKLLQDYDLFRGRLWLLDLVVLLLAPLIAAHLRRRIQPGNEA
ncbi:MAG TPA: hypothetical protein VK654_06600 [Nitrospirota bacterium]|nr:hypothetical protein [Nitrospirota bacterium]